MAPFGLCSARKLVFRTPTKFCDHNGLTIQERLEL
jgi:hypothetical protein